MRIATSGMLVPTSVACPASGEAPFPPPGRWGAGDRARSGSGLSAKIDPAYSTTMLYLVGGASRSGKSLLASRLLARANVPWLSLDVLRMGLARGAPALGFDPEADDLPEAARLWPIVRAMAKNLVADGRPYLLEGVCLEPKGVAGFVAEHETRACFLGYPRLDPRGKADAVRRHLDGPNDWLADEPDAAVLAHVAEGVRTSRVLEQACAGKGIPFFDTGHDFDGALAAAAAYLLGA